VDDNNYLWLATMITRRS